MATDPSRAMFLLRDVFAAPEEFRPRIEPAQRTETAARTVEPHASANYGTRRTTLPTASAVTCSGLSQALDRPC